MGRGSVAGCVLATACFMACEHGPITPPDRTEPPPSSPPASAPARIAEQARAEPTRAEPSVVPECPRFTSPSEVGKLADRAITEASGLVASRRQPGVLWVHNDSGDGPRIYAIDESGAALARYVLGSGRAFDWEDIALGPGPRSDRDYLYIGDIGDNVRLRPSVTVYRIDEPQVRRTEDRSVDIKVDDVEALELRYPDGARDAEALMVDPVTGDLFVVIKATTALDVLRGAAPLTSGATLERVASLDRANLPMPDPRVTAGDISPDGRLVGLRTYGGVLTWWRVDGESLANALARPACAWEGPRRGGGEALAWLPGSDGFLLVNEGRHSPLWRSEKKP